MSNHLFTPLRVGNVEFQHRVVMAPLTRTRANPETLGATPLMAEYYGQRATKGGLIVSEATLIAPQSIAHRHIPGIWSPEQATSWKQVTDAVHAKGGFIASQLWHQGRVAHHSFSKHPLAIAAGVEVCESSGNVIYPVDSQPAYDTIEPQPPTPPHAMDLDDIARLKEQFLIGADHALNVAGFDFIEIHGAHGYLLNQFIVDGVNNRTDQYGGSIENRIRLLAEIVELLTTRYPNRVGVRISPSTQDIAYFAATDSNNESTFAAVFNKLKEFQTLAYILITEPSVVGDRSYGNSSPVNIYSTRFLRTFHETNPNTKLISSAGYAPLTAFEAMNKDIPEHDAIAFGRFFISNPDLVFRLQNKLPLTVYNRNTFYLFPQLLPDGQIGVPAEEFPIGYTDYPTFAQQVALYLGKDVSVEQVIASPEKQAELVQLAANDVYKLVTIEDIGHATNTAERKRLEAEKAAAAAAAAKDTEAAHND